MLRTQRTRLVSKVSLSLLLFRSVVLKESVCCRGDAGRQDPAQDEWVAYVTPAAELDNSDEERRRVSLAFFFLLFRKGFGKEQRMAEERFMQAHCMLDIAQPPELTAELVG